MNIEFALETPHFSNQEESRQWWPPKPCTGFIWADIIWLAIVLVVNQHIIPAVFGWFFPIDLITPWLVIIFVVSPPYYSFCLWLFASLLLETSSTAPKGLYLCGYWIILSIIMLSRKTLSWKLTIPWLVTFFFASFWIGHFETLMVFLTQDSNQLDFTYFFSQMFRVLISVLIGMSLAQSWMRRFKGERMKSERSIL